MNVSTHASTPPRSGLAVTAGVVVGRMLGAPLHGNIQVIVATRDDDAIPGDDLHPPSIGCGWFILFDDGWCGLRAAGTITDQKDAHRSLREKLPPSGGRGIAVRAPARST